MTKYLIITLTTAVLVSGLGFAPWALTAPGGQEDEAAKMETGVRLPEAPKTLKKALIAAMRSNPDLRLAEAKLAEARANRDRVRLQIARDLVRLYGQVDEVKLSLELKSQEAQRNQMLIHEGQMPQGAGSATLLALAELKAKHRSLHAEIDYHVGSVSGVVIGSEVKASDDKSPNALMGQRVPSRYFNKNEGREAARPELKKSELTGLNGLVEVPQGQMELGEFLKEVIGRSSLRKSEVVFTQVSTSDEVTWTGAKSVPLREVLDWVSDQHFQPLAVLFRSYGLLVTTQDRARSQRAPSYPALPLVLRR